MVAALGCRTPAVIKPGCLVAALQYLQHAANSTLVSSYEFAIALVGASARIEDRIESFCLLQDVRAGC